MRIDAVKDLVASAWQKFTKAENARFISEVAVRTALQKDKRMSPLASPLNLKFAT
jgi:hypothetical protein